MKESVLQNQLLLPSHQRVVIEMDGKQHYADGDVANHLLKFRLQPFAAAGTESTAGLLRRIERNVGLRSAALIYPADVRFVLRVRRKTFNRDLCRSC